MSLPSLVLLLACGPLPPPTQVAAVGLGRDTRLPEPCPTWCQVDGQVRALTTVEGVAKAYEVTLPPADWNAVLSDTRGKWGGPDAIYFVDRATGDAAAWEADAKRKHADHLGAAAAVLRVGDPTQITDYAVWSQGGTLVRVANDKTALRAAWVDLAKL